MTYNLDNNFDRERFTTRCRYLMEKRAAVDLTEHTFRSSSQNRYLHLLIGLVTLRSSADLTKEEMSMAIDRFKTWGRLQGWAMPDPGDTEILRQLEIEMSRQRAWM